MGKYLEQQYDEREYALELAKKHNLLHEDKKNMTFEELKEKAKEMGYRQTNKAKVDFYKTDVHNNLLEISLRGDVYFNDIKISEDRTPDQMLAIMKALQ